MFYETVMKGETKDKPVLHKNQGKALCLKSYVPYVFLCIYVFKFSAKLPVLSVSAVNKKKITLVIFS